MPRIGLVAGEGRLPIVFARIARSKGDSVIAFGLKGVTDPALEREVERMHWLEWGALQKVVLLMATERIKKIILLGKIRKDAIFRNKAKLDEEAKKIFGSDKKDYALLDKIRAFLKKMGIDIMDSTIYLEELIPQKSVLTKAGPTEAQWRDIEFGASAAKAVSRFDIGQTVAVKDLTVVAVEAAEGTDETIARAGRLVKDGLIVVKCARPNQDMRFDVPLVGLDTLRSVIDANGKVLAIEEKKTLLMDREELVKLADEKGIAVVII